MEALQEQLAALPSIRLAELKIEWRRVHHIPPPVSYTADLLMRGIAHKIQEKLAGKLSLQSRKYLENFDRDIEGPSKPANGSKPGTCFVRSWKGRTWTVMAAVRSDQHKTASYRQPSDRLGRAT